MRDKSSGTGARAFPRHKTENRGTAQLPMRPPGRPVPAPAAGLSSPPTGALPAGRSPKTRGERRPGARSAGSAPPPAALAGSPRRCRAAADSSPRPRPAHAGAPSAEHPRPPRPALPHRPRPPHGPFPRARAPLRPRLPPPWAGTPPGLGRRAPPAGPRAPRRSAPPPPPRCPSPQPRRSPRRHSPGSEPSPHFFSFLLPPFLSPQPSTRLGRGFRAAVPPRTARPDPRPPPAGGAAPVPLPDTDLLTTNSVAPVRRGSDYTSQEPPRAASGAPPAAAAGSSAPFPEDETSRSLPQPRREAARGRGAGPVPMATTGADGPCGLGGRCGPDSAPGPARPGPRWAPAAAVGSPRPSAPRAVAVWCLLLRFSGVRGPEQSGWGLARGRRAQVGVCSRSASRGDTEIREAAGPGCLHVGFALLSQRPAVVLLETPEPKAVALPGLPQAGAVFPSWV